MVTSTSLTFDGIQQDTELFQLHPQSCPLGHVWMSSNYRNAGPKKCVFREPERSNRGRRLFKTTSIFFHANPSHAFQQAEKTFHLKSR